MTDVYHHVKFYVACIFSDSERQTFNATNVQTLTVIVGIERYIELANVASSVTLLKIVEVGDHGPRVPNAGRMKSVAYAIGNSLRVELPSLHALNTSYILVEAFEHDGDWNATSNLFCLIDIEGYRLLVDFNYHSSKSIVCGLRFQFCRLPRILVL